ncbi:MAG TPA: chromate resistance protein ChrB domain-containing protein [Candidatus Methylomirabilis sp.]|nr:chromate resistance protein ChrB domain-containing protein [Candidatus Methylomirabilis sp.]
MKWVTREGAKTDRVACPWLIQKFIDPQAEFLFVPKDTVLEVARREVGKSFDCPGADFTHRDGKCSFEVLVEAYRIADPGVQVLAPIVHGADIPADVGIVPEAAGLQAIAHGFAAICADDHRKLELEFPVYDALYAWCRARAGGTML